MKTGKNIFVLTLTALTLLWGLSTQAQVTIDNDELTTTVGYWRVDVNAGGEANLAFITAVGTPSNTQWDATQVIFDYFTYIDVGPLGAAFQLPTTVSAGPTLINGGVGTDQADSSGTFVGAGGNNIDWAVSSTIEDSSITMVNTYTFTAQTGTLGNIRLWQYLDEDVLGPGNDFFLTKGSFATLDLELFTLDSPEAIGVSHSGALVAAQDHLVNSDFVGYAGDQYNGMKGQIVAGTQAVSPAGVISANLGAAASIHPVVGPGYGPIDVVSVIAWDVDPAATTATIITTMGGVPEAPPLIPTYTCWGDQFLTPFDDPLTLKKKVKRVIPVKMVLDDEDGNPLTDADFNPPNPPVINVMFSAVGDGSDFTESEDLLPAGQANDDNIFRWDPEDGIWIYNLSTKLHMAAGLYKVTAVSGDEDSYTIDSSSCQGTFLRQN